MSIKLVRKASAKPVGDNPACWGKLRLRDSRDIECRGLNGLAHWLRAQRPPVRESDILSLSLTSGDSDDGVQVHVGIERSDFRAVSLSVYGTNNLAVPGVYDEMRMWLDRGKRRMSWPYFRPLSVLLASLWVMIAALVIAVAISTTAWIVVLCAAVLLVLAGAAMEFVVPRIVPPLELLAPDAPPRSDRWVTGGRAAALFLLGAAASAVIYALVDNPI